MNASLISLSIISLLLWPAHNAFSMVELDETDLSEVSGQAIMFNLVDFSLSGDMSLTYTGEGEDLLTLSNIHVSHESDVQRVAEDPYKLEVVSPEESLPQAIRVSGPSNDQGAIAWHFAADWGIHSDGRDFSRGAFVVENLRSYGSSLTLSPPSIKSSSYIVFGASIGVEVGSTSIMPLGRDNEIGQLSFSGINVGAVDGGAWTIATLGNQPGILKAVSDGNDPYLEFNISWPENGKAAMGKISVDNIDLFGATGLGGFGVIPAPSRIGFAVDRVQLQYLNIKLRP